MIHTYHLLFSCSYALKSAQVLQANFILEPFLTFLFNFLFSLVKCKDCLKFNLPLSLYICIYVCIFGYKYKADYGKKDGFGETNKCCKEPISHSRIIVFD